MHKIKKMMVCMISFIAFTAIFTVKAQAAESYVRLGGSDRYDTSVQISQKNWDKSEYVILASGENFPDALSATPLAKKYDAPILLTPKDSLNQLVSDEIKRLQATHIIIVGGPGAVSDTVKTKLMNLGLSCSRISGMNRYETSLAVAKALGSSSTAALVSGEDFPDAVSIAELAAQLKMPILLTSKNSINSDVKNYLTSSEIQKVYIIGGTGVIYESIKNSIPGSQRLSGTDRFATNLAVIREFAGNLNFSTIYTASGASYSDALAGSAAAVKTSSPLFLVNSQSSSTVKDYVSSVKGSINQVMMLGGIGVMPSSYVRDFLSEPKYTIVIDPGHGIGDDVGATGNGLQEDNITLSVGLKTGKILQNNGINVVYTRTTDMRSVPMSVEDSLQKRCDISNNANADYFICIHTNAFGSSSANGTETLYYPGSEKGKQMALSIQNSIVKEVGTYNRGLKDGSWLYVVQNTDASAVLTELGFLTNPDDASKLASDTYRQKFAQAIADGILQCLN